jgi:hypothetical protein
VAPDKKKSSSDPDPRALLDERRAAALSEVQLFRSSLASLQARLPNLEAFIAASGPATDVQHSSHNLDAILRNFGNPVTALRPEDAAGAASTLTAAAAAAGVARMTGPSEDQANSNNGGFETGPPAKRIKLNSASAQEEQEESAAVEASVSLEFAVSLSRRLSRSGLVF